METPEVRWRDALISSTQSFPKKRPDNSLLGSVQCANSNDMNTDILMSFYVKDRKIFFKRLNKNSYTNKKNKNFYRVYCNQKVQISQQNTQEPSITRNIYIH